jgi:hypothetical protein
MEYEKRFKKGKQATGLNHSQTSLLGAREISSAQVGTTNYSSNLPPVQSASQGNMGNINSESIINVAVGESAFVNSNVGITLDKH